MSTDELLQVVGSGHPVSVQSHIIKVSVLHFNFDSISIVTPSNQLIRPLSVCLWYVSVCVCYSMFQMFENIKTLRLETNLNGMIVIKGMLSTEGEFLQFQDEGS